MLYPSEYDDYAMNKILPPNTILQNGRYCILRQLGVGGVNAIYEAYAEHLNIKVALKELQMDAQHLHGAFEQEAQRLARLRHIALPNVIDTFVEGKRRYFVMEYIEGQDFAELLVLRGEQPFLVQDVLDWADMLLDVLNYLHQQAPPVIHHDLKPANIRLMPDNQVVLLDFGLARGGLAHDSIEQSLYGYSLGYAPPEQLANRVTNARSDLYALAATLYHLFTAHAPPNAQEREKAIQQQQPDPLLPVNKLNPDVPLHVAQLLSQALALNPANRPTNAAEMRQLLRLNKPPDPMFSASPSLLFSERSNQTRVSGSTIGQKWRLWLPIAIAILLWIMIISGIVAAFMNNP